MPNPDHDNSRVKKPSLLVREFLLGAAAFLGAAVYLAGSFIPDLWSRPFSRAQIVLFGWTALALAVYLGVLTIAARKKGEAFARAENRRWILLGMAGLFLLQGMTRCTLHGGGDARWYCTMLADMLSQTRAGVFPVWVGQSQYQFNGALYPLRVAPAFHYLGALLDVTTLRTLEVIALQNLLLVLVGIGGIFSAYFSLGALLPDRRQLALGLAILFLACPGVLGVVYNTDLYMSWTTLPWVPLVWFATIRSFRDGGSFKTMVLLGASLGLCWWGHSPIALWMTLFAALAQIVRCVVHHQAAPNWLNAAAGALAFVAVAAYPIGSVLFFPPDSGMRLADLQPPTSAAMVVQQLQNVFPAVLLPLSKNGGALSDFQLGYALWGILAFALCLLWRARRVEAWVLLAICGLVVLLLMPIPRFDLALWSAVPAFVRNITARWVMNRLHVVLAGAIVYAFAAAVPDDLFRGQRSSRAVNWMIALGCAWSLWQALNFANGSPTGSVSAASALNPVRLENVMVTRYAYFGLPRLPAYFTHGVADPGLENRLWNDETGALVADNLAAARLTAKVIGQVDVAPSLDPGRSDVQIPLQYGSHYLLAFDFKNARSKGVLQIRGTSLYREYGLPEYGEAQSFGAGGPHTNLLPIWTSNPSGETATLRFIPDDTARTSFVGEPFNRVTWMEYDPALLPVQVFSWVPYRAHVRTSHAAWLETPRMFQRGYVAKVNGRPAEVRKSTEGLVSIHVPAGISEAELKYHAPFGLVIVFWLSLGTIVLWLGTLGVIQIKEAVRTLTAYGCTPAPPDRT
jgi:hypothetical protein